MIESLNLGRIQSQQTFGILLPCFTPHWNCLANCFHRHDGLYGTPCKLNFPWERRAAVTLTACFLGHFGYKCSVEDIKSIVQIFTPHFVGNSQDESDFFAPYSAIKLESPLFSPRHNRDRSFFAQTLPANYLFPFPISNHIRLETRRFLPLTFLPSEVLVASSNVVHKLSSRQTRTRVGPGIRGKGPGRSLQVFTQKLTPSHLPRVSQSASQEQRGVSCIHREIISPLGWV